MDVIAQSFQVAQASGGGWEDLTDGCLAELGPLPAGANLGFVYVTDALDEGLRLILKRLRAETRIHHWVGTIGFGICVSRTELFDVPAMAIMVGAVPRDSFCLLPAIGPDDLDLPDPVVSWAETHTPMLGVVHADPRVPDLEAIFTRIQNRTGCFLVGGMTASRGVQEQIADEVMDGGVSGILFGSDISVVTGLTQGCSPIGPTHQVTGGSDHVLHSLDDRPALEVFREDIGELLSRNLDRIGGYVHAAIPIKGSDTGDYLVRNLLGLYPDQGWVSIGERLDIGDRVMFVRRDGASALADLKRMVADVKRRADTPPRAALYYSCVARGPNLFGQGSVELKTIADILGDVPLIGFFANGEISNNRLYGYTGVLSLIL
ncbi:MAG: FIST C-terminal domain-containing protein [Proteobacteria bacterium]|nr:FIST C-terminal domain-containing protein [Pseudomonadota bacterium]